MWARSVTTPPYEMREIELTRPLEPIVFADGVRGAHVVLRGTDADRLDAAMAELRKAFPE